MTDDPTLDLAQRTGLPPALRVLVEAMPRMQWKHHPEFGGLAAFWMDRHLMFRRMTAILLQDAEAELDGNLAPDAHRARLSRVGAQLLGELEGHHQIEDAQYFPIMAQLEPRVAHGFDLLDADHHSLHDLLDRFATSANAVLRGVDTSAAGRFHTELLGFDRLLARHLEDEEDLVVPVILTHGLR